MFLKQQKPPSPGNFLFYTLLALFVFPTGVFPTGAVAEGLMITPYLGYRVGGNFTDIATGLELELVESDSYGLIIGRDNGTNNQLEFIYSLQSTQLEASGIVSPVVLVDVDVENFLVAGKRIMNKDSGAFVSGIVGVTRFNPESSSLNSETRFALGLGGGTDYPIGKNFSLRLEGRGIATFLDSNGAVFCGPSGGCLVYTESNVLWQFEVIAGITFRF